MSKDIIKESEQEQISGGRVAAVDVPLAEDLARPAIDRVASIQSTGAVPPCAGTEQFTRIIKENNHK